MLCPRCALERLCVSHCFTIPIFLKCHKAWGTSNKCLFNKIQNSSVEGTSRWIKITYWWTFSINYIFIYWVCSKVRAHWFINTYWPHIYIPFLKNNWMCEILPDITGQPLHFVNSTYRVITCQVFSTTIKSSPSSHLITTSFIFPSLGGMESDIICIDRGEILKGQSSTKWCSASEPRGKHSGPQSVEPSSVCWDVWSQRPKESDVLPFKS